MKIAKYELVERLGEGGMGEVWRAVDETLKRQVAIKFLPVATASDPELRARFLREARLAARLNHPHIATIFAVEEHESALYLVMELVTGTPLDRVIAGGPMAAAAAVDIMLEVATAIGEAHAFGIIHRDIKPEHIMIAANGVKVLFGVVIGRPEGPELDARSDVFSLGVVLYEMLSGRKPFVGDKPHEPLTNVPRWLAAVVDRCLAKNPSDRFQTANELADALSFAEPERARGRVLVADDDEITRILLRAHLESIGYDVDEVADGSEAIARLKKNDYALLITDLLMPRLDGWSVLDFLRSSAGRRPARIFVTSVMRNVTLSDADRQFVHGVIAKPITEAQLREVLAT